jgi:hypothetical protein
MDSITLREGPQAIHLSGGTWEYVVSRISGLLERAVVRGDSWLAGPLPDLWASGAVDPQAQGYHARYSADTQVRTVAVAPDRVVLESEGGFARVDGATLPLRWQLRYTFDLDGTVEVEVTVRALARLTLRWLSLGQVRADPAACRFVVHEGDVGEGLSTCRPVCHALGDGDFEAGGRFIPWLQLGNDRSGLDLVYPHSDRSGWSWTDSCPYPSGDPLGRAGDRMVVRATAGRVSWEVFALRNLHEPVDETWTYRDSFFVSAVPGKEPDPRANDLRVWWLGPHQYHNGWRCPDEEVIARWAADGANLVIGGVNWRSGDYSHPDDPDEVAEFIATCHRYDLQVIPYLTFTDLEFGAPAFDAHGRDWRIEPVAEYNYRSHLMCYGAEGWQEHWEREVAAAWDSLPFDGLYIDFWAGKLACNNPRHGCVGPHGRLTVAGLRRLARFANDLVAQRDGLIVANCNILPLAMLNNWFDVRLLGEWGNLEEAEGLSARVFHNSHRFGSGNLLLVSQIPHLTERTLALTAAYQGPPVLSQARTPGERELLARRARLLASFGVDRATARNAFELPASEHLSDLQPSLYTREDNGEFLMTLSRPEPEAVPAAMCAVIELCPLTPVPYLVWVAETGELLGGRALCPDELRRHSLAVPGESLRTLWLRPDPGRPCLLCALSGGLRPADRWDADQRTLRFTVEHPALAQAEVNVSGEPVSVRAGEQDVAFSLCHGTARATVPCNTPITVTYPES